MEGTLTLECGHPHTNAGVRNYLPQNGVFAHNEFTCQLSQRFGHSGYSDFFFTAIRSRGIDYLILIPPL